MGMSSVLWPKLRIWHWFFLAAALVFWTIGPELARRGRHFGPELFVVFPMLFLLYFSPLFILPSGVLTVLRYKQGRIDRLTAFWRLVWALALLINFVAVMWVAGAFG